MKIANNSLRGKKIQFHQSSFTLLYEIGALRTFLFIISLLDTSFITALHCPSKLCCRRS